MNFAYQRRTPATFTTNTTQTRPTTTIAAMGETELGAETLAMEDEEGSVTLPFSDFMNLTNMAGVEVDEDEFAAAVEDVNFQ